MIPFRSTFELLFPWVMLVALIFVSWIYVLIPSARKRYEWLTWRFLRAKNNEQKQFENALALAVFLLIALTSTTPLIFALVPGLMAYEKA